MNANAYVNFRTENIIRQIDMENIQSGKAKNTQNRLKPDKNFFGMDAVSFNTKFAGSFELMTYQKNSVSIDIVQGFLPWDIVDKLNDGVRLGIRGDIYTYDYDSGLHFSAKSIPPLSRLNPKEVKAENNVISFGDYPYFKYVSKGGQEYYMHSGSTGFGAASSEELRGVEYSKEAFRYISFWNKMMVVTGPNLPGGEFTRNDVKEYLEDAGIQPGFFTVNMKEESKVLFYSQGEYTSMVIRKSDYDILYNNLTRPCNEFTSNLLSAYEPGSIIKVSGKEYILSESHTLDLPYGADIYDMKFPKIAL